MEKNKLCFTLIQSLIIGKLDVKAFASDLLHFAIDDVAGFDVAYQLGLRKIILMNQNHLCYR